MSLKLDTIDIDLLKEINQNPGQPKSSAVVALVGRRKERTLQDRLTALELHGFISVDRSVRKGFSLATITPKGKAAIKGREDLTPSSEASS
jgi:DNA-binding HxlR family transcriptional regulator